MSAVLAIFIMGPVPAVAGEPANEPDVELAGIVQIARYRASVFSYQEQGWLLWLEGPARLMRLEIGRGLNPGQDGVDALLSQAGQGWTAILGGPGDDTFNSWGQAWRRAPAGLRQAAQFVSEILLAGPAQAAGPFRSWRSVRPVGQSIKFRIGSLSETPELRPGRSGFRGELAQRGLGRGGTGEILDLTWRAASADSTVWLSVRSTRRPGRLELASVGEQAVVYAMPEAFVPLWPLAALIDSGP